MPASSLSDANAMGTDVWKLLAGSGSSESGTTNGIIGAMYLTGGGFSGTNTPGLLQTNVKVEPFITPQFGALPDCHMMAYPSKWSMSAMANAPKIHTRMKISAVFTSNCESNRKTELEIEYLRQNFVKLMRNAADPTNATFANFGFTGATTFADSAVYGTDWGIEFFQDQDYTGSPIRWYVDGATVLGASGEVTVEIGVWRV